MDLSRALMAISEDDRPPSFEVFRSTLDPQWVDEALTATGTATMRRRRLPADHAVWLVIGMAMYRDRPIAAVAAHLDLVLPAANGSSSPLAGGAVVRARDRLGAEPLEHLFRTTGERWALASADAHRWRGLAVLGVDGSSLRVADTPENETRFGRPGSARSKAGYPQLRLVALMALRSHLLVALKVGALAESEVTLAETLWDAVPERSLTILDRGFLSFALLSGLRSVGVERHWLVRAKINLKPKLLRKLGPKDDLVEVSASAALRRRRPELPAKFTARLVRYRRKGFREQTLLTSLTDHEAYPAAEITALYHERWELELGFDELKTHTLERQESLRSHNPDRTQQEVWGLAVAYNLVRRHMEEVAEKAGIAPTRLSFRGALLLMRDLWRSAWFLAPGTMARHIERVDYELARLILPPRRPRKSYPRAVKLKQSVYDRKR